MMMRFPLVLAVSSIFLAACQVVPTTSTESGANQKTAVDPNLPRVPLTGEVLYFTLLGEIAGHRGQLDTSVGALTRAAQKTHDPRIAERATLAALYARKPQEALANAQLWAELRPASKEAIEALAAAYMENGRHDEARVQFEALIQRAGPTSLAQTYLRIAAVLGRQANRSEALNIMRQLVEKHTSEPAAQFALAHLAVRISDLATAMKAIDRALDLKPDWEDAALFKARVLVSQKDMAKVQRFHEQYLADHSRAMGMRVSYARVLIDLKQWDKARAQYKQVAAANPRDAEAMFMIAQLALQSNDLKDAEAYLLRTLELQPENDQARLTLGQVAEQQKRFDDAIAAYSEVDSAEHHFEAQTRMGVTLAAQGKLDQARLHLHTLLPKNEAQKVQLALAEEQILRDARRYTEAFEVLTRVLGDLPENIDLLYARALVAEKLNQVEAAEKDLRHILKKDPKNTNALNALGYTLADRTTRFQEALGFIEQALAQKPDDPFILDSMGWVQYRLGNHAEAVKHLRAALDKRADAEIAAHLGEVLWVMGDRTGAEQVWTGALKHTPDNEALLGVINKFKASK